MKNKFARGIFLRNLWFVHISRCCASVVLKIKSVLMLLQLCFLADFYYVKMSMNY